MQGTYWLTILPETSKLVPGIKKATANADVTLTPKFDTRGAARAGQSAGRDLQSGVESQTRGSSFGSMFRLDGARSAGSRAGGEINAGLQQANIGRGVMSQMGSNMMSGAATLGRRVGSVIATGLKASAVIGGGALAAGLGMALKQGFSRLTAIDDAKFKLQGLGNSAGQVQSIMDNALTAVKGTAFGLDEAATTAASAVAAGIKPGEQLTGYLKLTADTAAIAGTSLADMGSIFNKVQTSGKAFTGDLNMLSDRGLPVFQWLQDEYKVSGEGLAKMVEDGKVDSATFQRVIAANIGGAAQNMGQSVRGSLSNLKASFSRFGAELSAPLFAALQPMAIGLTGVFDKVTAAIKPIMADLAGKVGPWATDMANRMKAWADNGGIDRIIEKFTRLSSTIKVWINDGGMQRIVDWFSQLKSSMSGADAGGGGTAMQSIADAGKQLGPALQQAGPALAGVGDAMKAFGQAMLQIGPQTLTAVLVPALQVLATTLKFVADNASWAVPVIGGLILTLGGLSMATRTLLPIFSAINNGLKLINTPLILAQNAAIRQQAAAMTQLSAALGTNTVAQNMNTGAQDLNAATTLRGRAAAMASAAASRVAAAAQWLWNAALTANPIGLIVAAVVAAGAAIWAFFTKTETGRQLWDKIWNGIKNTVGVVWNWLKTTLATAWTQIGPSVMKIAEVAKQAFGAFGGAVKTVWTAIQPAIAWVGRLWLAVSKLEFTVAIAALKALGSVIGWLWTNVVVPAFSGIATAVQTWWAGVQIVWSAATTAVGWVGDKIMWLWNTVAVPAFSAIGAAVSTFWDGVKGVWDLFTGALDKVGRGVGVFKDGMVTAFNAVKDVITTVWGAIGGIWDKIVNGIGTVTNALKGAGGKVLGFLGLDGGATGGQVISRYAGGGQISGPGTGTSDSILGFPAMVRVANGEWITNAEDAKKNAPLLALINSGVPVYEALRRILPGFAGGGLVSANDLVNFASGVEGQPYVWGGTNWGDCSGAVSAIANYATGREPFSSRFSTASEGSELSSRGFQSGLGPAGSLNIGWYNGGPGGGHTAATLPDGTHFEMGGARGNGQFGGSAAGAEDSQFTSKMHLPPEYFDGLDGGAPTRGGSARSLGSATSASGGGGSYRSATDKELSSSSKRVDTANTAVKNAQQSVDDRTYARDRAQKRVDELAAAGKDTADAQHSLDVANRELGDANERLTKARDKASEVQDADNTLRTQGVEDASKAKDKSSDNPFGDLGKSLWGGLLETVGLDGSVFSNPFEWPTVKSVMAGVNFFGGLLSGGDGTDSAAAGSGDGGGLGGLLGGVADAVGVGDMLKTVPQPGDLNPGAGVAAPHIGSGAAPGPAAGGAGQPGTVDNSINLNGNVGMNPSDVIGTVRSEQNHRTRTTKVWQ